jgi:cystathionine gamma-synthase
VSFDPRFDTTAVRTGLESDTQHGAVVPPLHLSSTYTFEGLGQKRQFDYGRSGNPTRAILAETLAALEGGEHAVVTASGMAAITTVLQLLEPGDRLVMPHDCYGGTWRLVDVWQRRGLFEVEWVNLTDPETRRAALAKPAKLVWVETPSNPLLRITDLAAVRAEAPDAILVVDNTFLSPALQRPFEWGADVVVHSTTKYLNGHSDVVGGAVIAREKALGETLGWWANCLGLTGAPFDAWLTLRGIRTLPARMALHLQNAQAVVELLDAHPAVAQVYYPGRSTHPGHAVACRQQRGFGAMISFELHPIASGDAVQRVVERLRHFSLAESLGGTESLVAHPASMTHASMSAEARAVAGISDHLVRLSVGIESGADLVADLRQALDAVVERVAVGGAA